MRIPHFLTIVIFVSLISINATENRTIRQIRLENLKKNYSGKSIRFLDKNQKIIQGVLVNITKNDFILYINNSNQSFSHEHVDFVFYDPEIQDFLMVSGLGLILGTSGYLGLMINNPESGTVSKTISPLLGTILGVVLGHKTLLKPVKVDISGKTIN